MLYQTIDFHEHLGRNSQFFNLPIDDAYNIKSFRSFSRSVSVEAFHYKGVEFEEAYKFHNLIIKLLCTK